MESLLHAHSAATHSHGHVFDHCWDTPDSYVHPHPVIDPVHNPLIDNPVHNPMYPDSHPTFMAQSHGVSGGFAGHGGSNGTHFDGGMSYDNGTNSVGVHGSSDNGHMTSGGFDYTHHGSHCDTSVHVTHNSDGSYSGSGGINCHF